MINPGQKPGFFFGHGKGCEYCVHIQPLLDIFTSLDEPIVGKNSLKPKFKIWATIAWGYRYALKNPRMILRFGWLPMIIYFGILLLVYTLLMLKIDHPLLKIDHPQSQNLIHGMTILPIGYFAVRWHRSILLNERHQPIFRFGWSEINYSLMLLPMPLIDSFFEFIESFDLQFDLFVFLSILLSITSLILGIAIPMLLPGLAIRDSKMSLERAWSLWAGNRVRFTFFLLCGYLICAAVYWSAVTVLGFMSVKIAVMLGVHLANVAMINTDFLLIVLSFSIEMAVLTIVVFFMTAASLGSLSISYAGISHQAERRYTGYVSPIKIGGQPSY